MTPSEALAKLPGFLDANPVFLTDPAAAALLEKTAEEEFHVDPWAYGIALNAYKKAKETPLPVIASVDVLLTDPTGALKAALMGDSDWRIRNALATDKTYNLAKFIVAMAMDSVPNAAIALARDSGVLIAAVIADPTVREDAAALAMFQGYSVEPSQMPSPERIAAAGMVIGVVDKPEGWRVEGSNVYDETGTLRFGK